MAQITLKLNAQPSTTIVSNRFIDEFMADANGEYVKIYLYLLRCAGSADGSLSVSKIADKFDHTEKDVKRSLRYWQKAGLLHLEYDESKNLTGVTFLNPGEELQPAADPSFFSPSREAVVPVSSQEPESSATTSASVTAPAGTLHYDQPKASIPAKPSYTADKLREMSSNSDITQLIFITEQYLGKTLSRQELETLFYFYDELHFSIDLIEYLIEYCVSKGSKSFHYIEKVAIAWAEDQVKTVEDAKKSTNLYIKNCYSVLNAFGIKGRNPVEAELDFIKKWLEEYCFTLDIIAEACSRTILSIHKPSFEYADSILKKWKEKNVRHLSDVKTLDEQHQKQKNGGTAPQKAKPAASNKFNNFNQRTYDYDQLEKQLLNNSTK